MQTSEFFKKYKYRILFISLLLFVCVFLGWSTIITFDQSLFLRLAVSLIIVVPMIVSYWRYGRGVILHGAITFLTLWITNLASGDIIFDSIMSITLISFFIRLTRIIIHTILHDKHISNDLIVWGVAGYMMIAISWFFLFIVLDVYYKWAGFVISTQTHTTERVFSLLYYSFTTLTTIWYGDIVPATPLIQLAVVLYSITGWSYTTFILAMILKKFDTVQK